MKNAADILTPSAQDILFDVEKIRRDFPILNQRVRGKALVYLDNAATSQKPRAVIEALQRYYETENSNVHRGVHYLSEKATNDYEEARTKVQRFINAPELHEVIFVRGTTEGINLVAQTYGRKHVKNGNEVLISALEHHSNIVPWQILCEEKDARLRVVPINDDGEIVVEEYKKLLTEKTKLVSLGHVSNALGTINPIKDMIAAAHNRGVPVLVDGAQAVPHMKVDIQDLDADFYVFSGHKMFGPTGIGVVYGKTEYLESMPPYQGGGDMIKSVTFEKTIFNDLPYKFEAGTPNIEGAIGLGVTIDYLNSLDWKSVEAYEHDLFSYATDAVSAIKRLRIIGTAREKASVLSFVLDNVHPHDVGTVLDQEGIAIRTGHHCAQPVMQRFGVPATARASFAFYNTKTEVDALVKGIYRVMEMFG